MVINPKQGNSVHRRCCFPSNVKSMAIVFYDYEEVLHHEYAPRGQKINKEY